MIICYNMEKKALEIAEHICKKNLKKSFKQNLITMNY